MSSTPYPDHWKSVTHQSTEEQNDLFYQRSPLHPFLNAGRKFLKEFHICPCHINFQYTKSTGVDAERVGQAITSNHFKMLRSWHQNILYNLFIKSNANRFPESPLSETNKTVMELHIDEDTAIQLVSCDIGETEDWEAAHQLVFTPVDATVGTDTVENIPETREDCLELLTSNPERINQTPVAIYDKYVCAETTPESDIDGTILYELSDIETISAMRLDKAIPVSAEYTIPKNKIPKIKQSNFKSIRDDIKLNTNDGIVGLNISYTPDLGEYCIVELLKDIYPYEWHLPLEPRPQRIGRILLLALCSRERYVQLQQTLLGKTHPRAFKTSSLINNYLLDPKPVEFTGETISFGAYKAKKYEARTHFFECDGQPDYKVTLSETRSAGDNATLDNWAESPIDESIDYNAVQDYVGELPRMHTQKAKEDNIEVKLLPNNHRLRLQFTQDTPFIIDELEYGNVKYIGASKLDEDIYDEDR